MCDCCLFPRRKTDCKEAVVGRVGITNEYRVQYAGCTWSSFRRYHQGRRAAVAGDFGLQVEWAAAAPAGGPVAGVEEEHPRDWG